MGLNFLRFTYTWIFLSSKISIAVLMESVGMEGRLYSYFQPWQERVPLTLSFMFKSQLDFDLVKFLLLITYQYLGTF